MAKYLTIAEVMRPNPTLIESVAPVADALSLMRRQAISCLVIPRKDLHDECGMLLITDIAREIVSKNRSINRTQVYEIMTKPAPSLDAAMTTKYAIRHMERFALTHSIVVNGRDLVGIVTLKTLVYGYLDVTDNGAAPNK